jgi:predicted Fe-Mo cluster-binding NifX family protein
MSICITADSAYTDGKTSEFFGRCRYFIFVSPETGGVEVVQNAAASMSNAGVRAAASVIRHQPSAIVTGSIGKNALRALKKAGVKVFTTEIATVAKALDLFLAGKLEKADSNG